MMVSSTRTVVGVVEMAETNNQRRLGIVVMGCLGQRLTAKFYNLIAPLNVPEKSLHSSRAVTRKK